MLKFEELKTERKKATLSFQQKEHQKWRYNSTSTKEQEMIS